MLGIWKMEESREALIHLFPAHLRQEVMAYINDVRSDKRAIEWLSTRIMLLELLGKEQIIHNREDLKTKKFVTIPLRSVAYAASNTTNKLAGSYFSVGLTSALVNPTERVEKIEAILRV